PGPDAGGIHPGGGSAHRVRERGPRRGQLVPVGPAAAPDGGQRGGRVLPASGQVVAVRPPRPRPRRPQRDPSFSPAPVRPGDSSPISYHTNTPSPSSWDINPLSL